MRPSISLARHTPNQKLGDSLRLRVFVVKAGPDPPRRREDAKKSRKVFDHWENSFQQHARELLQEPGPQRHARLQPGHGSGCQARLPPQQPAGGRQRSLTFQGHQQLACFQCANEKRPSICHWSFVIGHFSFSDAARPESSLVRSSGFSLLERCSLKAELQPSRDGKGTMKKCEMTNNDQ